MPEYNVQAYVRGIHFYILHLIFMILHSFSLSCLLFIQRKERLRIDQAL